MKVAGSWLMFGDPFHIRYLANFLKLFNNLQKVLLADISDGIPCLFVFLRPYFSLEIQSGYQPLFWSSQLSFLLWRFGFHLVQTVKLCWDIQGDNLVVAPPSESRIPDPAVTLSDPDNDRLSVIRLPPVICCCLYICAGWYVLVNCKWCIRTSGNRYGL